MNDNQENCPSRTEESHDASLFSQFWCHFDMLSDQHRNSAYDKAIERAISYLRKQNTLVHTLDIGTGSGLLALLANKHGSNHTIAIEEIPEVAKIARENYMKNKADISLIEKNSALLKSEDVKMNGSMPNLLVSEILDTDLIGEGVIPSITQALSTLCADDPIVIPARATVKAMLVSGSAVTGLRETDSLGICYPKYMRECKGSPKPEHVHIGPLLASGELQAVSDEFELFNLSFSSPPKTFPVVTNPKVKLLRSVNTNQEDIAVAVWWTCEMLPKRVVEGSEQQVYMSTAPNSNGTNMSDHWRQALYPVYGDLQGVGGDTIAIKCSYDEYEIWFEDDALQECECRIHALTPRSYWYNLNHKARFEMIHKGYQHIFKEISAKKQDEIVLLSLGCSPVTVALGVRHQLTCRIVSWCTESKFAHVAPVLLSETVLANKRENQEVRYAQELCVGDPKLFRSRVLGDASHVYVIYDPSCLDAGEEHCAQTSWFNNQIEFLVASGLGPEQLTLFPTKCRLETLSIQVPSLEKLYEPITTVCGVDMTSINALRTGEQDDVQTLSIGQYGIQSHVEKRKVKSNGVRIQDSTVASAECAQAKIMFSQWLLSDKVWHPGVETICRGIQKVSFTCSQYKV